MMKTTPTPLEITTAAATAFARLSGVFGDLDPKYWGLYLMLQTGNTSDPTPYYGAPHRFPTHRDYDLEGRDRPWQPYRGHAGVKVAALVANPDLISSWQVRDDKATPPVYGGGIRTDVEDCVVAGSGCPEPADELICLVFAQELKIIGPQRIHGIVKASSNELAAKHFSIAL